MGVSRAAGDADLRCRQAHAVGGVHGLEHVLDQLLKLFVEGRDLGGGLIQHWVAVFDDGVNHQ